MGGRGEEEDEEKYKIPLDDDLSQTKSSPIEDIRANNNKKYL